MDAINWNQLAIAVAGLALTIAGLKANRWIQSRRKTRTRISKALKCSVMYREVQ